MNHHSRRKVIGNSKTLLKATSERWLTKQLFDDSIIYTSNYRWDHPLSSLVPIFTVNMQSSFACCTWPLSIASLPHRHLPLPPPIPFRCRSAGCLAYNSSLTLSLALCLASPALWVAVVPASLTASAAFSLSLRPLAAPILS